MKRIWTLLWVLAAVWGRPASCAAQAETPPCRYLILYDASATMAKAAPAGGQAVASLIYGGFQGQLKPGEMFNVWLFNQQVYTNRFAPMTWQPGARQALADNTLALLKILKYEKEAKMPVVWRDVLQAARNTETLTVFLFTANDQPFMGTPFDVVLNQLTKDHLKELRRAKKPLLATLVAVRGQFVAYTIGMAGNPIDFASLDRQLGRAFPAQPAPALVTNIIVTNIIVVTNPVYTVAAPIVAAANPDQETKPTPAPTPKPEGAPAVSPVASNEPPSVVLAAPPALKPAEPAPPAATPAKPVETAPAPEPVKPKEPEVAAPAEPVAEPPPVAAKETPPAAAETMTVTNQADTARDVQPAATPPSTESVPTNAAAAPVPTSAVPATAVAPASNSLVPLIMQSKANREPVPQHLTENRNWGFGVFALASVVAGIALFSILRGRTKRKAPPSFISQSIDRHMK